MALVNMTGNHMDGILTVFFTPCAGLMVEKPPVPSEGSAQVGPGDTGVPGR